MGAPPIRADTCVVCGAALELAALGRAHLVLCGRHDAELEQTIAAHAAWTAADRLDVAILWTARTTRSEAAPGILRAVAALVRAIRNAGLGDGTCA